MMSNTGQTLRINMKDVRVMGRSTQGVRLVSLHEGDYLVGVQKIEHHEAPEIVAAAEGAITPPAADPVAEVPAEEELPEE